MKIRKDGRSVLLGAMLAFSLALVTDSSYAVDDDVPFFAGQAGSPNVMILFDNSDSMQDSPYLRKDGVTPYRPGESDGNTYWRQGVKIASGAANCDDGGNCIKESSGNIEYDYYKYVNTSDIMVLPGQLPPNLPGLASTSSTVTYIRNTSTACSAGMECDYLIYDSNVDWTNIDSIEDQYRYWKVEIKDDLGNVQYASLQYNAGSTDGYWRIEYHYGNGYIEYDPARSYTYTIVSGVPGEVTYKYNEKRRVYDRNFDWSTLNSSVFDELYKGKTIEVYQGTDSGEQRMITGYDSTYGFWKVNSNFTAVLDLTSKYRIIGEVDDGKWAIGGNHPDSKMYQAKLALQQFLDSDSIKTCDETDAGGDCIKERYLMNLGFATFLQAREPRVRAKYFRKRGVEYPDRYSYRYRQVRDHSSNIYINDGCSGGSTVTPVTFEDPWDDSVTHSGVDVGYEFDRAYHTGQCDEQTIRYRITSITCSPTDPLPNRMRVIVRSDTDWNPAGVGEGGISPDGARTWGYTTYTWQYFEDDGSQDCTTQVPALNIGDWVRMNPAESCYEACRNHAAYIENPYYQTTWRDTWGDLRKSDPATPGYIDTATADVTPSAGYCSGDGWNCTNPDPEDISGDGYGDWKLLEVSDEPGLVDVAINSGGTIGTLTSAIFDYSAFRYPGIDADDDHPHGWSYKRTTRDPDYVGHYQYRKDDYTYIEDDHFIYAYYHYYLSTWRDDEQKGDDDLYDDVYFFPSVAGNEFSNYVGDDQIIFVDLPEVDESSEDKGDDLTGANKVKIGNYLDLSRQMYLRDTRYVYTMAPINPGSMTVSTETAQAGNGTPLAATLANARRYYQSYMEQDPYTQGGCRDNYVILLTDGLETTADGDPEAEAAALQSMTVNGQTRSVPVYVIGFGLDDSSKATLNAIAAAGGTGSAYFADDVDSLVGILADDIASDIKDGVYGRSTAAVGSNQEGSTSGNALYFAAFDYPTWRGHLWALELYTEDVYDVDGTTILHEKGDVKGSMPYWASGCIGTYDPPSTNGDPDAGCILAEDNMTPGDPPDGPAVRRVLYTTVGGNRIEFTPANVDLVPGFQALLNPDGLDIDGNSVADEALDAKAVTNYVHHPGFDSAAYVGTRDENWPLADIYNSSPVVVTAPPDGGCVGGVWTNMDGYCTFRDTQSTRKDVIYIGTNGGTIEAFAAGKPEYVDGSGSTIPAVAGGYELWGYMPNFVLGKLHEFSDGHRFTMDLGVSVADMDTSEGLVGSGWKTILIAGQRQGGSGYVALDVTDPDDPQPMWEFSDANLGQTWSRPSFGRLEINGTKVSVVFFGGGYSPDADKGNRLYVVRASDGTLIKEFVVGSAANNVPSQLSTMRYLTNGVGNVVDYRTHLEKLPDGTVVDYSDWRDFIEAAYFGDTSGTVWRLRNLNNSDAPADAADPFGPPWSTSVSLEKLYVPDSDEQQPIYYKPYVYDVQEGTIDTYNMVGCVKRYVLVGTGDEQEPSVAYDVSGAPILDYFFELEDREYQDSSIWTNGEDDDHHLPAWTTLDQSEGKFRLNWRASLGLRFPTDSVGFILDGSGVRLHGTSGKYLLDMDIYIMDRDTYIDDAWSVDVSGNLLDPDGDVVAVSGEYYFEDDTGLYAATSGGGLGGLIMAAGTYQSYSTSWVTDEKGCLVDPDDASCLLTASTAYSYNNDGEWSVDNDVVIVEHAGEKVLSTPQGAQGYVFFTSYSPKGGCAMGESYYNQIKFSHCDSIFTSGAFTEWRKVYLGRSIASGVTVSDGAIYVVTHGDGGGDDDDGGGGSVGNSKVKNFATPFGEAALLYWKQQ